MYFIHVLELYTVFGYINTYFTEPLRQYCLPYILIIAGGSKVKHVMLGYRGHTSVRVFYW